METNHRKACGLRRLLGAHRPYQGTDGNDPRMADRSRAKAASRITIPAPS